MTTRVYKYMHIYLWSAAWQPYRVVLNMEASVQAAGEDGGHVAGGGRLRGLEKLGVRKPGTGVLFSARQ